MALIHEKLYQSQNLTGLQLVSTLVNQLRGKIELVSHPEQSGTEFQIIFPTPASKKSRENLKVHPKRVAHV